MEVTIRTLQPPDYVAITAIYNHYIQNTVITFETEILSVAEMSCRIDKLLVKFPFLVAEGNNMIIGYAYAGPWKDRAAYFATVESSVYLHPDALGSGAGYSLYEQLLPELKTRGIHSVIGGIALPNPRSISLHLRCGFEFAGILPEVGFKFEEWIDVAYYVKTFN